MSYLISILTGPLWPALVTFGLVVAFLPWLPHDKQWGRACVIGFALVLTWQYMVWRALHTLPPLSRPLDLVVGLVFLLFELLTAVGTTSTLTTLIRQRARSREADAATPWLRAQKPAPLVDVFICTYNEEQAILETTIVAALNIDYPNFRVWVLDDGRRAWLEAFCARKGCLYLNRPDNSHAKAGNINHALRHVCALPNPPDFMAIFDADFAPIATFLKRVIPMFRDPTTGLVQTPQHFTNPDPIQSNLTVAKVFPDEQRFFFDVILACRDAWGLAFCCGTSSVTRVAALRQIGGIPTDSVTEDYLLTLRLEEIGYETVYLNERLSVGLAPEGLREYAIQRSRWCLGLIQIFRGPDNPFLLNNGLSLAQRVGLVESFLYWSASFPFRILCIVVPILYWAFAIRAVYADLGDAVRHYLPYFISSVVAIRWIGGGRNLPLMAETSQLIVVPEVLKAVVVGLIRPKGHKFQVTPKGGQRDKLMIQWRPLLRFVGLGVATVASVAYAFMFDETRFIEEGGALSLFWTWYSLCVIVICCLVCIEQPRYRKDERHSAHGRARLTIGNRAHDQSIIDLSAGGILLRGNVSEPIGTPVIAAFHDLRVPATIVRKSPDTVAVRIDGEEARTAMIRHLYSGRYGPALTEIHGHRVAMTILQRALR